MVLAKHSIKTSQVNSLKERLDIYFFTFFNFYGNIYLFIERERLLLKISE